MLSTVLLTYYGFRNIEAIAVAWLFQHSPLIPEINTYGLDIWHGLVRDMTFRFNVIAYTSTQYPRKDNTENVPLLNT